MMSQNHPRKALMQKLWPGGRQHKWFWAKWGKYNTNNSRRYPANRRGRIRRLKVWGIFRRDGVSAVAEAMWFEKEME